MNVVLERLHAQSKLNGVGYAGTHPPCEQEAVFFALERCPAPVRGLKGR
jgi:hypothetical protein